MTMRKIASHVPATGVKNKIVNEVEVQGVQAFDRRHGHCTLNQ